MRRVEARAWQFFFVAFLGWTISAVQAQDCQPNGLNDAIDITLGASEDCNGNDIPDECDLADGFSVDLNTNSIPDECDLDCNGNDRPDDLDVSDGTSADCNTNGIPDSCDLDSDFSSDANGNSVPDECEADCNQNGRPDDLDVSDGTSADCNSNAVPDECELSAGGSADENNDGIPDECQPDCNTNGHPDDLDVTDGTSQDCNGNDNPDECDVDTGASTDVDNNSIPDECEADCNQNGLPDGFDLTQRTSLDCNQNGTPDECDLAAGGSSDRNSNEIPDECETDCNQNGRPDDFDISEGDSPDCNSNEIPDGCDVQSGNSNDRNGNGNPDECEADCNQNGSPDDFDISEGNSPDCNSNGIPDSCDIAARTSRDRNDNDTPDECETDCNQNGRPDDFDISEGDVPDCNSNGIPDGCDLTSGGSNDRNSNAIPDECEADCNQNGRPDDLDISDGTFADCNSNGVPDGCDISSGASSDCQSNGIPDECDPDCNANQIPDACDFTSGSAADCNANGIPDVCDVFSQFSPDCNENLLPDDCEIQSGQVGDCNQNSIPDDCEEGVSDIRASFDSVGESGCPGLSVQFQDTSQGAAIDSYLWDFGDGGSSTERNPTHVFRESGTYSVRLTVSGGCGAATETKPALVNVQDPTRADFFVEGVDSGPAAVCAGEPIQFFQAAQGQGLRDFQWSFGDGDSSGGEDPVHLYEAPGSYTVSLTVTGDCGSDTFEMESFVTAEPPPTAVASVSHVTVAFVNDFIAVEWPPSPNAAAYILESRFGNGEWNPVEPVPVPHDPSLELYSKRTPLLDRVGNWFFRVLAENDCGLSAPTGGPVLGVVPDENVASWPITRDDCNSSGVIHDVEAGNDGTIFGQSLNCGTDRFGANTEVLRFRGGSVVAGSSLPIINGEFTISLWVLPTGTNASPVPFFEITADDLAGVENVRPLRFLWQGTQQALVVELSEGGTILRVDDLSPSWHHVAVARANGILSVFVDGTLAGTAEHTFSLGDAFAFGGNPSGTERFEGSLDEILYEARGRGSNEVLSLIVQKPSTAFLEPNPTGREATAEPGESPSVLDLKLRTGPSASSVPFLLSRLTVEAREILGEDGEFGQLDFIENLTLFRRSSCDGENPTLDEVGVFTERQAVPGRTLFDLVPQGDEVAQLAPEADACFEILAQLRPEALSLNRQLQFSVKTSDDLEVRDGALEAFVAGQRRVNGSATQGPILSITNVRPEVRLVAEAASNQSLQTREGRSEELHGLLLVTPPNEGIQIERLTYRSVNDEPLPALNNVEIFTNGQRVAGGGVAGDGITIRFQDLALNIPASSDTRLTLRASVVPGSLSTAASVLPGTWSPWLPHWIGLTLVAALALACATRWQPRWLEVLGAAQARHLGLAASTWFLGTSLVMLAGCGPAVIGIAVGVGLSGGGGGGGGNSSVLTDFQVELVQSEEDFVARGATSDAIAFVDVDEGTDFKGPKIEVRG